MSFSHDLKPSHYLIKQDIFDQNLGVAFKLLFSSRSASLVRVEKSLWQRILDQRFNDVDSDTLADLQAKKFLVPAEENELDEILAEFKAITDNPTRFYMAIQPTAACPLGCGYCGQVHSPKGLSAEKQEDLINHIDLSLMRGAYENMRIHWFGGEPLSGFSVMTHLTPRIAALAQKYHIPYSAGITTNGLLLRREIAEDLIHECFVSDIEITLDGTAEYHDKRRHLKSGGATFDKIYDNLTYLLKIKPDTVQVSLRCNTDRRNKEGVLPLIHKLANDGLLHEKIAYFYAAPVHSWGNDAHELSLEPEVFAKWEVDWLIAMEELGVQVPYLPEKVKSFCMTLMPGHALVDPFGDIFKCTEVSLVPSYEKNGKNQHRLGNVSDQETYDPQKNIFGHFLEKKELQQYECYTCPMLPVCGGACPKEWVEGRKPCPPAKYNIKERMLLHLAQTMRQHPLDLGRRERHCVEH